MSTPAAFAPLSPRARRGGMGLGTVLTGLMLVLVFAPPLLSPPWRAALMQAFHAVCHQMPERSFHLAGVPLAVCHRCTGIYAGLFAGTLLFPLLARADAWLWRHTRWLLMASLLPMGADWTGDALGLFVNTPLSQSLTGAAFGVFAAYLLARGLAGLFVKRPATARTQPDRALAVE